MKVLAICGSPHREGLTPRITREAAKGAEEAGATVELFFLAEHEVKPCIACPNVQCWTRMECTIKDDSGLMLRQKLNECDAFIVSTPVYFLSINGLAKGFMDRMRYYEENGKPALPITAAGGTGKGCINTLQALSLWLVLLGFRPQTPLPVTRYNADNAMTEARRLGQGLVQVSKQPAPFAGLTERMACYEALPYMDWGPTEELMFLARIAIEGITQKRREELGSQAKAMLQQAETLLQEGQKKDALEKAVAAHEESMRVFNSLR